MKGIKRVLVNAQRQSKPVYYVINQQHFNPIKRPHENNATYN